jgi:hypothetical protein
VKVTAVPNCCGVAVVVDDKEYEKVVAQTAQHYEKTVTEAKEAGYADSYSCTRFAPFSDSSSIAFLSGIDGHSDSAGGREERIAAIKADLQQAEESVDVVSCGWPTVMMAIVVAGHTEQVAAFEAEGWIPVMSFTGGQGNRCLMLCKNRTNRSRNRYNGRIEILSPVKPPAKVEETRRF